MQPLGKKLFLALASLAAITVVVALAPQGVPVEVGLVARGPLAIHAEGSGRVRVRDRFVLAAPVSGHLQRIAVRAGDRVEAGSPIAHLRPATPLPLDARSRAEARAKLAAAEAASADAANALEQARAERAHAERERDRLRQLSDGQVIAPRMLEVAELAAGARARAVQSAELALRSSEGALLAARAFLARFEQPGAFDEPIAVFAPTGGTLTVLRVLAEHESPIAAGTPLLELGNPAKVEAVVELLTTDAVRVAPGARVAIEGWGGREPIAGRVRLVEPSAFTKISALGVEEQRVLVVIDPDGGAWERLSDGYRVEAKIAIWERPDTLKVPTAALFRESGGFAAFAVRDGVAVKTRIDIGERGPREAELVSGLQAGDRVVLFPGGDLGEGDRVVPLED